MNITKTSKQPSICLVACAANEKLYIKEWVEYYLNVINVDRIIIVDNNFSDDEKLRNILRGYNKVTVINTYRKKHIKQIKVFGEMYKKFARLYDWVVFFDVDEYLVMNNGKSLKSWLSKIDENIDEILINWKIFDDNDLVKYDNRPVMKRFTREYVEDKSPETNPEYFFGGTYHYIRDNFQIKSIIRGKVSVCRFIESNIHKSFFKNGKYVDSDLNPIQVNKPNFCSIDHITYKNCQLNHYIQKTIDEYADRAMARTMKSCKIYKDIDQIRHNFQRFNKWTDEKEKILQDKFKKKK